jgi:threonine dehydratase
MTATTSDDISAEAIVAADAAIRPHIRRTPVVELRLQRGAARDVTLKLELLQHSGSFKVRGAFTNLLQRRVPAGGVVAASGGNHGAAVAYAAQRLGIDATIFVPEIASAAKIDRIRSYDARLIITGRSYSEALAACEQWIAKRDVMPIHAFDQRETIVGQGTLARELEEQVPDADTVLVAVGGGGLLAGIAAWYQRRARVIGVEPRGAPTLARALEAGGPVDVDIDAAGVAADSLAPRRLGRLVFDVVRSNIHDNLLVSDQDIRAAQRYLWDTARIVAEPGGAAALAAILSGAYAAREGERVVVIVSGGNTTAVRFEHLLNDHGPHPAGVR